MPTPAPPPISAELQAWLLACVQCSEFSAEVYTRLFRRAPSLRMQFSTDLTAQQQKLQDTLVAMLSGLDAPETLAAVLAGLGVRHHRHHGVATTHYLLLGQVLEDALANAEASAPAAWRPAWQALYAWVTARMLEGATRPHRPE